MFVKAIYRTVELGTGFVLQKLVTETKGSLTWNSLDDNWAYLGPDGKPASDGDVPLFKSEAAAYRWLSKKINAA